MQQALRSMNRLRSHRSTALQAIVARETNPLDAAVVSVTQIHGGDAWNVIPDVVTLRGSWDGPVDATWSVDSHACGHSFYLSGIGHYFIYSSRESYSGGSCGVDVIAGRSWAKLPNSGCSASKVYVR